MLFWSFSDFYLKILAFQLLKEQSQAAGQGIRVRVHFGPFFTCPQQRTKDHRHKRVNSSINPICWTGSITFFSLKKYFSYFFIKFRSDSTNPLRTNDAFESYQRVGLSKWCQKTANFEIFCRCLNCDQKKAKKNKMEILNGKNQPFLWDAL